MLVRRKVSADSRIETAVAALQESAHSILNSARQAGAIENLLASPDLYGRCLAIDPFTVVLKRVPHPIPRFLTEWWNPRT